jgi:hypothetical protein
LGAGRRGDSFCGRGGRAEKSEDPVGRAIVQLFVWGFAALVLVLSFSAHAQNATISELHGKIFDAHMAEKTFEAGLRHCGELDGTRFYYALRNRVLELDAYHRSLESLVRQRVYNTETGHAWTAEEAEARWDKVKHQAVEEKETCEAVAHLPQLEKELAELEKKAEAAKK